MKVSGRKKSCKSKSSEGKLLIFFIFFMNEKKCVHFFWSCLDEALDVQAFLKGSHNVNYTLKFV